MVLGWDEGLEGVNNVPGRKRKIVFYWEKLMREVGVDWTEFERRTKVRNEWKICVREQIERLHVWEKQMGHKSN